jgi:hypothetical protein
MKFMSLLHRYCNKYSSCIDINYIYTLFLTELYLQAKQYLEEEVFIPFI